MDKTQINEILISASVLSTYWEYNKNDTLDLLLPFLKHAISSTTKVSEKISIHAVTEMFKKEYGYYDIPLNVISTMMNRLSPTILERKKNEFFLKVSLEKEYNEYESKKIKNKERQKEVVNALQVYLSERISKYKFDYDSTIESLFAFFQYNGLFLLKSIDDLNDLKYADGKINYEIAHFILKEHSEDSLIFDYIVEMIKGYFVSTALAYQNTITNTNSRFKRMNCYLDTRIIINALGLHLPEEITTSTKEFLEMLTSSGAELLCFTHNLLEVKSILTAYKTSLSNTKKLSSNTLELFDQYKYTESDVEDYISLLEKKLLNLGIKVVDAPQHTLDYAMDAHMDYQGLISELREKMHYNKFTVEKASEIDCKSIQSILLLRNGNKPTEIERAEHIFVSPSNNFCNIVNSFLGYDKDRIVPAAISELDLSSWLWLRNYSTHKEFPKSKLLVNAMAISEMPTPIFLDSLFDKLEKMQAMGALTSDEAITLRSDMFCRKEIYKVTGGDSEAIDDESIFDVRARLRETYNLASLQEAAVKDEELKKEQAKNNDTRKQAHAKIAEAGNKAYKIVYYFLMSITTLISVAICVGIIILYLLNSEFINKAWYLILAGLVFSFLDIWGYIQCVLSGKGAINKQIKKIAHSARRYAEDKKRTDLDFIFKD